MSERITQTADPAADNSQHDVALDRFPCSATQERCWFLDRMNPGTPALNVAIRWNVTGRFSAAAFKAAFRAVIARHEILRTRFVEDGGRPVQEVTQEVAFHLSEIDIRTTAATEQDARVDAIATENAGLPFDLTKPGPIRATLIRLGEDRAILAITVHQICFDGWSIRILGQEIGEYAAAFEAGVDVDLPDLPLQYGDYAMWQREYFDSPAFMADLAPWRERLAGAPYFELQPDFARPLERSAACGMVKTDLPPAFGVRLNDAAKERAMSPFAYGSGVLSAMLSRCADVSEVTIGTQVAGRTEVDLEPLIGVFINNVVMRFPTDAGESLAGHLDRSRDVVREALIGQHVPFNKLVEILNPARDASRTPLISVNFILQHAFMETARYGNFELSSAPSHAPGAIYDLSFVLIGRESGWRMTLEYNSDLFDIHTAQSLLDLWQEAFNFAFDHADQTLSDMPQRVHRAEGAGDDAKHLSLIETKLMTHPQVAAAAAVPYMATGDVRRVHAFVAPDPNAPCLPLEILPALLRDHLVAALPGLPQPDGISVLSDLPRDNTGRVAKARLPLAEAVRAWETANVTDTSPEAPQTAAETEARLAPIWAGLLGLDVVPPTANFFDLGGHSLLTVRMLAGIEREFGQRLSLATVFQAPTLRALATHLAGTERPAPAVSQPAAGESDWRVLVLQEGGTGIPLIAINNAQTVYALSQQFATPRPALGVRIHDKSRGTTLTPRSFDAIAAEYVDAVRSAQAKGPYALFGLCVHGNLAVEVARQLQEQGEEVAAVILKDVWEPTYADRINSRRWSRMQDRLHFLKIRLRFLRRGDISLAAFLGMIGMLRRPLNMAVRLGLMDRVRNTDLDAEQEEFIAYLSAARNQHRPAPYYGTVLHFVTSEAPSGRSFDCEMGWGKLVSGQLQTRAINELSIAQGRNIGVAQVAGEIEALLKSYEAELDVRGKAASATRQSGGQVNAK